MSTQESLEKPIEFADLITTRDKDLAKLLATALNHRSGKPNTVTVGNLPVGEVLQQVTFTFCAGADEVTGTALRTTLSRLASLRAHGINPTEYDAGVLFDAEHMGVRTSQFMCGDLLDTRGWQIILASIKQATEEIQGVGVNAQ